MAGRRRRGTILIVTMWIMLVLAGLVLVLTRSMRAEGDRTANDVAAVEASAVEQGAIQYVMSCVDGLQGEAPLDADVPCEAVQVGDGLFWILRPSATTDDTTYSFGITDETAKVNLNTATQDMLMKLPKMTQQLAASIIDWRDADSTITSGGAESEYYLLLPNAYECKDAPLETVEELMLIRGATKDIVYGTDPNRNGVLDPGETATLVSSSGTMNGSRLDRGIINFITVYSAAPSTTGTASGGTSSTTSTAGARVNVSTASITALSTLYQPVMSGNRLAIVMDRTRRERPFRSLFDYYYRVGLTYDEFQKLAPKITTASGAAARGQINVNTAPPEVLRCLPLMEDADVSTLIAARPVLTSASTAAERTSIAWVVQALTREKAIAIGPYVTGLSYQFSADIVSVSGNGRAFRRCHVVLDASASPPKIVYRQNLTHLGWPLNPDILTNLRSGLGLQPELRTVEQGTGSP